MPETSSQPPPSHPLEKPITVEFLNDWWFLLLAIASIVAYLVRLEVGVTNNRDTMSKIENETLPTMHKEMGMMECNLEARLVDAKSAFSSELRSSLDSQKIFIQSRFDILIEKLSTRDESIANLKAQADRQGRELRELESTRHCENFKSSRAKD